MKSLLCKHSLAIGLASLLLLIGFSLHAVKAGVTKASISLEDQVDLMINSKYTHQAFLHYSGVKVNEFSLKETQILFKNDSYIKFMSKLKASDIDRYNRYKLVEDNVMHGIEPDHATAVDLMAIMQMDHLIDMFLLSKKSEKDSAPIHFLFNKQYLLLMVGFVLSFLLIGYGISNKQKLNLQDN